MYTRKYVNSPAKVFVQQLELEGKPTVLCPKTTIEAYTAKPH